MTKQAGGPITVLIVSDSHIIRSGLRKILESQRGFSVLGEVSIEKAREMNTISGPHVDLVILDLDPRGANGLPVINAIQKSPKHPAILGLIDLGDHELGAKALTLGAAGLVLKMQPASVLLAAIYELCPPSGLEVIQKGDDTDIRQLKNQKQFDQRADLVSANADGDSIKITRLTARELEVIRLIALGLKNKDIAKRLAISDITVRHHLTNIFCKLEVSDRQNLLILAHRCGLAELDLQAESA